MKTIGIATYSLRVRTKRGADYELLGNVDRRYNLADLLDQFLSSITNAQTVDEEAQIVLQATRHNRQEEELWGLLDSGEYGFAAQGVDVKTRNPSYTRNPTDAETIPFYYRAYLPKLGDLGLILLQRHGPRGVFTAFSHGFRQFFQEQLPDHVLEINRVVPAEVVRHLTDGQIRSIQVIAHSLPTDITDKLRFLGNRKEIGTFVIEAKAKKKKFLPVPTWLKRIRQGTTQVVELPTELRESDATVRIRVDYNGTTRTIDLSDPANIAPYINATEHLQIDPSGHPRFESIDSYAQQLIQELLQQLGRV